MFSRTTLVAWAALALAAWPSLAADETVATVADKTVEKASYSTARAGRQAARQRVTIWRGGTPTLASTSTPMEEEVDGEVQPMPPNAPEAQELGSEGDAQDSGSPFVDEATAPESESGGSSCSSCGQEGCTGCGGGDCNGDCGGACGGSACGSGCGLLGPGPCTPWWAHRTNIFGEYRFLGASGVDTAYARQQVDDTPFGRVGTLDQNFSSAYRAGGGIALGQCASIQLAYANFHSDNTDSLSAPNISGGNVRSLVLAPNTPDFDSTGSFLQASGSIDFQTGDVDYQHIWTAGERFLMNYSVGGRYGKLEQTFNQVGNFETPSATIQNATNVTFEGGGPRLGLDAMQRLGNSRFGVYGNGFISVLLGTVRSQYAQTDMSDLSPQALTQWNDERVVPVLEYEVGINFTTCGGWRWSTGYYNAFWFNSVSTGQFVQAVQSSNFVNLGETVAFSGVVSRLEYRF